MPKEKMEIAKVKYAAALCDLGVIYANGWGVEENEREAVKWFRKAADLGDTDAMYYLGVSYASGPGVEEDDREAVKWLRRAADLGYTAAHHLLSVRFGL